MRLSATALFYAVAIVLIAAAVVVLAHLLRTFEADLESNLQAVQRVFADENVLKTPDDYSIRFAAVEELARKYEDHGHFGPITVTKFFDEQERVVYPYYVPALKKLPSHSTPALRRDRPGPDRLTDSDRVLPLTMEDMTLGNLYIRLETAPLTNVRIAIASLSVLLLGGLAVFALQFRKQERVISQTTVELEEKRRELVRLERLALAGQLSANIFHDLKKPVLNIKDDVQEMGELPDTSLTQIARDVGKRVLDQVNLFFGILRESSLERFVRADDEREFVDINELIERSLALVRYERGSVSVETEFAPALPPVFAGPVRLIQVFSNLVLNAYQAMDGRGRLLVKTAAVNGIVNVEIRDTGPGIPESDLENIFRPFFTTKPRDMGTGLGLYISRDIVRETGGQIRVQSSPDGTTFSMTFPAAGQRNGSGGA